MRKNILKVIAAFQERRATKGDSKGTCSTDGESIFSYSTEIARRLPNGLVWLTTKRISATTNSQVRAIEIELGTWDGESWSYDALIRTESVDMLCQHGAEDEHPTSDHCWGNPQLMKACNEVSA